MRSTQSRSQRNKKKFKRKEEPSRENTQSSKNTINAVKYQSVLEEFMNTASRRQQIKMELQKHSLDEEEMRVLLLDLVEPLDLMQLILKK